MTQRFRGPGPVGRSPNKIGRRIPSPLRLSATDAIDLLRWTSPFTIGPKLWQSVTGVDELNGWVLAEKIVRASAARIAIPPGHTEKLERYANANPDDGEVLNIALKQNPSYYKGGWLLSVQGNAGAITFGNSIFFSKRLPDVDTYVHEMVHIHQYKTLGRDVFLKSYFGLSLATIISRVLCRMPVNAMNSSDHEEEAYQLAKRFSDWIARHP